MSQKYTFFSFFSSPHKLGISLCTLVSCGKGHTVALDNLGNLWSWVDNSKGQLGIGSGDSSFPTPIQSPSNEQLYDEYLDPYSAMIQYNDGNEIHKGVVDKNWHGTFKNTGLTDVDISNTKVFRGVKPMWEQLGFSSDEFDKPDQNFYWKNIIPSDFDL